MVGDLKFFAHRKYTKNSVYRAHKWLGAKDSRPRGRVQSQTFSRPRPWSRLFVFEASMPDDTYEGEVVDEADPVATDSVGVRFDGVGTDVGVLPELVAGLA